MFCFVFKKGYNIEIIQNEHRVTLYNDQIMVHMLGLLGFWG